MRNLYATVLQINAGMLTLDIVYVMCYVYVSFQRFPPLSPSAVYSGHSYRVHPQIPHQASPKGCAQDHCTGPSYDWS